MEQTMTYKTEVNTPLLNGFKACVDLRNALYDLCTVYSADSDFKATERLVKARDTLAQIEELLREYEQANTEALYKDLEDAGLV